MAFSEAFTILAVLEAQDKMSRVLERVSGSLDGYTDTALRAAEASMEAGAKIDASLLETASGADALELADARVSAAQAKVAETTKIQADAERALLEAQAQLAAAADGDTAATAKLATAFDALTAAQKRTALASKEATAAESHQSDVARVTAASTAEARAAADAAAASQARLAEQQRTVAAGAATTSKAMKFGALAVAAIGYESIKAAGNFESMTEHLVTDAGESQKNIGMIRSGMLALATATGTTTDQMAAGMYHVESAGFHGKAALDVLKTSAEGAKVGGADLDTIAQALTGSMNAFGKAGGTSTQMMNAMIATVGAGDMKMEALGSSLGNVAAIAASAGLSYAQVGAGIATMTAQNVSAQRATQDLAHTISSLSNPTAVQIKQMTAMGIDSNSLAKNLGKAGLTGTFDELVQAIAAHTKGGAVFVNSLNASKAAAASADQIIAQMPPTMAKMAKSWQDGKTSSADFKAAIDALPPSQQKMYTQFEAMVKQSSSFATSLKANTPIAQTFNATLAKMTGGTTSLNTILMLSGAHAQTFKDNVATISAAAHKSGSEVDNWSKIQGTFNQKLDVAKATVEAVGINLGTVLLPAVSSVLSVVLSIVGPMGTFIGQHQKLTGLVLAVAGGMLLAAGAMKAWTMATAAWSAIQKVVIAQMALFDAEADANPIGLIVLAIAALVAGLIYAYTHFKTFRDVVNDVGKAVMVTWKAVSSFFVTLWHDISTIFTESISTVVGVVKHWYPLILAILSGGILLLPALIFKYWSQISGFVSRVWDDVMSVTTTVWNAISGFFMKWWPLLLVIFAPAIAVIMALWNRFHQDIWDSLVTAWNKVSAFFAAAWALISKTAQSAWNLIKKYVVTPIQEAWAEIQGPIHAVESFISSTWDKIKKLALEDWAGIKLAIIQPAEDIWNKISSIFGKVKTAIGNQLTAAWNAVKNIGSKFYSVGTDIVRGIIQGVTGAGGGLFKSLENLANGALKSAKSFLGIGSPSKEFAEQVGQWIPHGIAQGVVQYASVAQKAVTALAGSLTGSAHTAVTASGSFSGAGFSMAPMVGAGSSGNTVNFDFRGSSIMSDADITKLTNKIGSLLATRHLPQAGVRIRM